MKCRTVTRKNSKLPPFKADTRLGKTKKGDDEMYRLDESANGVWVWKKIGHNRLKV